MRWLILAAAAFPGPATAGVAPLLPRLTEAGAAKLRPADKPDAEPAADESPAAIAERIVANGAKAAERLGEKDSGRFTQQTQQDILDDIDKLLNPPPPPPSDGSPPPPSDGSPPPPMGGQPPPMGGGPPMGGQPPPGGGPPQTRQQARQQQRDRERQQASGGGDPMPPGPPMGGGKPEKGGQPMGGSAGEGSGPPMGGGQPGEGSGRLTPPPAPPDDAVTKQIWGHLPDRLRQEVNQYYRERFMPKYGDMLRQYYDRLAEKEGKR